MPLPSSLSDGGLGLPRGLDYNDIQASFHLFTVPAVPPPLPAARRSRRPTPPCLVPDIDLVCEETLSEDDEGNDEWEEEEEEETAALWTRLKDPARHSFWEGIECPHPREAGRGAGVNGHDDCSDPSHPPPDKKPCLLYNSSPSGPPTWPEVRPASSCPEAVVAGRGRQARLCSDLQEVKAAVTVQVSQAATARGEVGQDGPANIRSHSGELSKGGGAGGESSCPPPRQASPTTPSDVTSPSWQARPYHHHADDDFHTVPDVDVGQEGREEEGGHLDADKGSSGDVWGDEVGGIHSPDDNLTTSHQFLSNQVSNHTSESYVNEDTNEDYYDEDVGSPLGSEDSYVLYSSQSSNEDEADTHHQRPLASCDVTYHVVPNAVIEE